MRIFKLFFSPVINEEALDPFLARAFLWIEAKINHDYTYHQLSMVVSSSVFN